MRKNLLSPFSNQLALCLALLCSFFFVFRNSEPLRWIIPRSNQGHELQGTTREPRFYIEVSKPDGFPITVYNEDEIKQIASLYKLKNIRNGDRIVINDRGIISLSRISGKKSLALGIPIGINSASVEDLEALPGIGPKLAEKIVKYRNLKGPFRAIEELRNIDGIEEKRLESIRPFINLD
ncbi:MAG: hypothetical protein C4291_01965 [Candidatus Dadabacteria bacterium]